MRQQSPEVCAAAAAGHIILTPNAELAAALMDMVERAHLHAGHPIWPTPQIRDFGSWLRERYAVRQLDTALPRLLTDIEERELWRQVILASDVGKSFLEPTGAARAARRARHAMSEYGIPDAVLADYASDEALALLDWSRDFDARCRSLDCISVDHLPAAQLLGAHPPLAHAPSMLTWIESPLWRPVARRWLTQHARLLQPGRCASLPPRQLRAPSPAAELAAVAQWAREGLASTEDFRAWICIPDLGARRAEIEDAFDAALAPQRFSLAGSESPAATQLPVALRSLTMHRRGPRSPPWLQPTDPSRSMISAHCCVCRSCKPHPQPQRRRLSWIWRCAPGRRAKPISQPGSLSPLALPSIPSRCERALNQRRTRLHCRNSSP